MSWPLFFPAPSLAHVCARVPGVLQVLGTPWEQPGDTSELSHVLCCAPRALHPRTGTGGRDFSQQLSFSSCNWTSWEWYKFSEEAAEPRVSPAWEGHSQGEPLPCSHLLQGGESFPRAVSQEGRAEERFHFCKQPRFGQFPEEFW